MTSPSSSATITGCRFARPSSHARRSAAVFGTVSKLAVVPVTAWL
jgi:hypothetical protein